MDEQGADSARVDEALAHISEKYGRQFVLDGSVESSYWRGSDFIVVHPEGAPAELAKVIVNPGPGADAPGLYSDDYIRAMWSTELTARLGAEIRKHLGDDAVFKVSIGLAGHSIDDVSPDTSIDAFRQSNPRVYAVITAAIPADVPTAGAEGALEMYELVGVLRSAGFDEGALDIGFVAEAGDYADYVARADIMNYTWANEGDSVRGWLSTTDESLASLISADVLTQHVEMRGE